VSTCRQQQQEQQHQQQQQQQQYGWQGAPQAQGWAQGG
jgi:hypothetical protein